MKLQKFKIGQRVISTCTDYRPGQAGAIVDYLGTRGPSNTMHWYGVSFADPGCHGGKITADLAHCELQADPAEPGDLDHVRQVQP